MARVRLYYIDNDRQVLAADDGKEIQYIYLRLTAMFRIGNEMRSRDGIFDSGTAFTVFLESVWRRFENQVRWLSFTSAKPIPIWWTSISGLTGGTFPCRLGQISFTLMDLENNRIDDVLVTGTFVDDGGKLSGRILLGLAHGILQGRRLTFDAERGQAWLEDRV